MRETIRLCTMCGEEFYVHVGMGRPPAFCSDLCRQRSKETEWRRCIVDEISFSIKDPAARPPFFCSDNCRNTNMGRNACRHCKKHPAQTDSQFCSEACWHKWIDPLPECELPDCDKDVACQPMQTPQKYCSERHRIEHWEFKHPGEISNRRRRQGNRQWHLEMMREGRVELPRTKTGKPFLCPSTEYEYDLSPREQRSIDFHREVLWPLLLQQEPKARDWIFMVWLGDEYQLHGMNMHSPWETLPFCWDLLSYEQQQGLKDKFHYYLCPDYKQLLFRYFRLLKDAHFIEQAFLRYEFKLMPPKAKARLCKLLDPKEVPEYTVAIERWKATREDEHPLPHPDMLIYSGEWRTLYQERVRWFTEDLKWPDPPGGPKAETMYGINAAFMLELKARWIRWCRTHHKDAGPAMLDPDRQRFPTEAILKWMMYRIIDGKVEVPNTQEPSKRNARSSAKRKRRETV